MPPDSKKYRNSALLRHLSQESEDTTFTDYTFPSRESMESRSEEIINQLNRLSNDRSLPPAVRNKIREAVDHIKKLQDVQTALLDGQTT